MNAGRLIVAWLSSLAVTAALLFGGMAIVIALYAHPRASMDPAGPIGWPPIQCGKPCVIEESHGGIIALFTAQAEYLKALHTPVIIDGPCISACTILADIDRHDVCVTTNAVFGIHQAAFGDVYTNVVFEDPKLNAYVKAHGGEPAPNSGTLLMVPFSDLTQFYKPCAGAV